MLVDKLKKNNDGDGTSIARIVSNIVSYASYVCLLSWLNYLFLSDLFSYPEKYEQEAFGHQWVSPHYYEPQIDIMRYVPFFIFSLLVLLRSGMVTEKFSASRIARIQMFSILPLSLLPLTAGVEYIFWYALHEIGTCLDVIGIHTPLVSYMPRHHYAYEIVGSTGWLIALVIITILVLKWLFSLSFPTATIKSSVNGVAIGAPFWSRFIGEINVKWEEIKKVSIHLCGKKRYFRFLLNNNHVYEFSGEQIQKHFDTAELLNDLRTNAPLAVDDSCSVRDESAQNTEYTELWLKYFTSSTSRTRTGMLQAGDSLHEGRYQVAGELGQGGQGTAYLASAEPSSETGDGADCQTIVLKEYILPVHRGEAIFQHSMQKLQHEAEILGKIHHPNIVELKDTFVEDHRGYLVLEYVEGDVLKELVKSQGPQKEEVVIDIALQMCDVLQHLHSMDPPVIHRDLTPDNMILQPDGKVKLVDFNVAHQLESAATATVVGKHAYIPPEQFRGKPTQQSDIFALGGTLFYLLTGKEPEPMSVSHPRAHVETISKELDDIIAKSTQLDQVNRYLSAGELREALLLISKSQAISLKQNQEA